MRRLKDKLVNEAIDFYKIDSMLEDDPEELPVEDELEVDDVDDLDFSDIFGDEQFDDLDFSDIFGDEEELPLDDDLGKDELGEDEFGEEEFEEEEEDPDKQGMIRTVRGAYLVYKRLSDNNNYEELWVFNKTNIKTQTKVKNDILAGTDIDPVKLISPDGTQSANTWARGNVQFLTVNGLPN